MTISKAYVLDALERVVWTGIQAGAGAALDVLVSGQVTARAIGYAVLVALLKVIVAGKIGDKDSASSLPTPPDVKLNVKADASPEEVRQALEAKLLEETPPNVEEEAPDPYAGDPDLEELERLDDAGA